MTLGITLALAAMAACAGSDEGNGIGPLTDRNDAGTLSPGEAGAADDAGDADAAVTIDAGQRECSTEGYCHTVLPKSQTLRGVWSDGAGVTWAVSEQGAILRYDGSAWSVHANLGEALWSIWGSGPTDIWIGGAGGLLHGEGASSASLVFTSVEAPGPSTPILSIWGTGAGDVWATGNTNSFPLVGRVLHYSADTAKDGGAPRWSQEDVTKEQVLWARVFGSKASGVWIAGSWFNPAMGSRREIMVLRRSAGASDFAPEQLPRDPDTPTDRGDFELLYDAAVSIDGASMWILGKTHGTTPAYASATSIDGGQTFTWTFARTSTATDPVFNAIGAVSTNAVWVVGDYGRLRHWNGSKWKQGVISVSKFPLTNPFYAVGGREGDLWFVGEDIALHRIPSKVEP
ncbi:MAG TPA: hypothetical protein VM925_30165 [Labilithrix sp.]|nr:hypothetical protein [Labilithrix sp.]